MNVLAKIGKAVEKTARCAKKAAPAGVAGAVTGGPLGGFVGGAPEFARCVAERTVERDFVDAKVEIQNRLTCLELGGELTPEGDCKFQIREKEYLA